MAVLLVLLAAVTAVVADELVLLDTTTSHCRTTVKVFYTEGEGELPYPVCSSRCLRGEDLWIDGVVFKRLAELEAYGLMVELIYINGSLSDCKMVPYETGEQATARQDVQKRRIDSCFSTEKGSQNETLVLSHTERIPLTPSSIPIHKRLEGFSLLGNSYYMVSPEVMTWHEAVSYCESLGATVASVESSQQRILVKGILGTGIWRALDDTLAEDNFANADGNPIRRLHVLCEHPLEEDFNQYACPNGYWKFKSSCYVASSDRKTYSEGEEFCSERDAYPVFINSDEELQFLQGIISWYSFLGYTDGDVEGKFVSKRFGLAIITRWAPNEPNDVFGDEDCVSIDDQNNHLWNDVPCSFILRIMCEKSANIAA